MEPSSREEARRRFAVNMISLGAYTLLKRREEEISRRQHQQRRQRRLLWVRDWLLRRNEGSQFSNLLQELSVEDHASFQNYMRLDRDQFREMLELVTPLIIKQDANMRCVLTPQERLAVTLRVVSHSTGSFLTFSMRAICTSLDHKA